MFDFSDPWIFLVLPLPLLIIYGIKAATTFTSAAIKVPFFQRIVNLSTPFNQQGSTVNSKRLLAGLIWLLLVIAAAGPEWLGPPQPLPQSGRNILLALDLSGSMQMPDMKLDDRRVDRLTIVKTVATEFVRKRVGDRIGLILFGTRAYLQTPLTFDHKTVQAMLDDATIGLAGTQTAIGDAIGLAVKHLESVPEKNRILILLTDGSSNTGVLEPIQAAKLAAQEHIKIYTIGIGANSFMVPGFFGTQAINPSADLDEDALKQIAALTGGLFFRATNSNELNQVYHQIDQLEPLNAKQIVYRPVTPYYDWPLTIAFGLSLLLALDSLGLSLPKRHYE